MLFIPTNLRTSNSRNSGLYLKLMSGFQNGHMVNMLLKYSTLSVQFQNEGTGILSLFDQVIFKVVIMNGENYPITRRLSHLSIKVQRLHKSRTSSDNYGLYFL